MAKKEIIISVEGKILKKLEEKSGDGGFDSVSKYVEFVLNEMVDNQGKQGYTPEEETAIKENLKDLGYI